MKPRWRRISFIYIAILLAGVALVTFLLRMPQQRPEEVPLNEVIEMSKSGQIEKLVMEADWLSVQFIHTLSWENNQWTGRVCT